MAFEKRPRSSRLVLSKTKKAGPHWSIPHFPLLGCGLLFVVYCTFLGGLWFQNHIPASDNRISKPDGADHSTSGNYDYTIQPLHGSNPFRGTPHCRKRNCQIHFPFVELQSLLPEQVEFHPVMKELQEKVRRAYEQTGEPEITSVQDLVQDMDFSKFNMTVRWYTATPAVLTQQPSLPKMTSFASLTRRGLARECGCNQDRAFLVHPYTSNPHEFLMGVMDGHGTYGDIVSEYLAHNLPRVLDVELHKQPHNTLDSDELLVESALSATLLSLDRTAPWFNTSGSTVSLVLQQTDRLYMASVGDSLSFVAVYGDDKNATIAHQSRRHKPDDPDERARIEQSGGLVSDQFPDLDGFRVAAPEDVGDGFALAMSRSIGDHILDRFRVIAEPTVAVVNLDDLKRQYPNQEFFVVSVTDGLFDLVSPEEIATSLADSMREESNLLLVCEDLIRTASDRWIERNPFFQYRDDVTIVVRKLFV